MTPVLHHNLSPRTRRISGRRNFLRGEGVSWIPERHPMPMASASDPSNAVGRVWTGGSALETERLVLFLPNLVI